MRVTVKKLDEHIQMFAEILALNDRIEKSMLQQKFRALESRWKILTDCLLDHPGTGKTNQRIGLGQYNVSQHGKAGQNPCSRRIAEHTDEQSAILMKLRIPEASDDHRRVLAVLTYLDNH